MCLFSHYQYWSKNCRLSLDFIKVLPKFAHVVVDKFSKYDHFIPLLHPYTAFKVSKLFISSV